MIKIIMECSRCKISEEVIVMRTNELDKVETRMSNFLNYGLCSKCTENYLEYRKKAKDEMDLKLKDWR